MSLLEQNITKKVRVDETASQIEFKNDSGSEKYVVKVIRNNAVYASKLKNYLPGLYYLILWKGYSEEGNT